VLSPYDYGAVGDAARARPSDIVAIEGRAISSRAAERITARRYSDATLYDRMHARAQLSDRQHQAATRLGIMWTAAGLNPRVCASYATVGDGGHEDDDERRHPDHNPADPDQPSARDRYRRLLREMPAAYAIRLDAMLLEQHPGVQWLATLQAALVWLCDRWGIRDE
jgi:hypothetical protein